MPTYRHSGTGEEVTADAPPAGYPWVDTGAPTTELAARTADAILADVGDDPALAQTELDAENARDKPRTSLVAKLGKIANP